MTGPANLVLDLPRRRDCLFIVVCPYRPRNARKLALVTAALVVAVVALARIATGLAPRAGQLLVALDLEPVAA